MNTTKTRRLFHAAVALVTGTVLAVGVASAGHAAGPAADTPAPTPSLGQEPPTIDPSRLGAIVIHKFRQTDALSNTQGNGAAQNTSALVPIPEVGFVVQQVDPAVFDLTTNDGWHALSQLTPESAATMTKGYSAEATTDAHGVATVADLPLGVYLVSEVKWPAGVSHGAPFLATVPMTDPESLSSWMYTVNVYPKSVVVPPAIVDPPRWNPTPAPSHTVWTPGPAVHTGGGADEVLKWMGQYWAHLCAVVAVAAGGTAVFSVLRSRRRRTRRAH